MNILGILGPFLLAAILVFGLLGLVWHIYLRIKTPRQGLRILSTGLKPVDLLVPIPDGGDVLVSGDPHAGSRVLGSELAYRLANHPVHPCRVIIYLDSEMEGIETYCLEMREILPALQTIYVVPVVNVRDIRQHRGVESTVQRDAIFAVSKSERFVNQFQQAVRSEREAPSSSAALTTFIVTEAIAPNGQDATLICSQLLAEAAIYPAIDLRASSSVGSTYPAVTARQRRIADEVRIAVNEVLANLHAGSINDPNWSFNSDANKRPAMQALRFMSQPYFTAEAYTGLKSEFVELDVMIDNFSAILSGHFSDAESKSFMFKNRLQR